MAIKQRLKKLEHGNPAQFREILQLIQDGAYYDELTAEQQRQYKKYRESLGGVANDISFAELTLLMDEDPAAFHFQLQKRRKPPTEEEHAKAVEEIKQLMNEYVSVYNTPVEQKK